MPEANIFNFTLFTTDGLPCASDSISKTQDTN